MPNRGKADNKESDIRLTKVAPSKNSFIVALAMIRCYSRSEALPTANVNMPLDFYYGTPR